MNRKTIRTDITDGRCPTGTAADCDVLFFESEKPFTLLLRPDGGEVSEIPAEKENGNGGADTDMYAASPGVLQPGLYFYSFDFGGLRLPADGEYQLTVYSGEYRSPDGFSGGIIYQIFPDRFAAGESDYDPSKYPERKMHGIFSDVPEWRSDENGEYPNNDYFGGNLKGIESKLDYLAGLGVTAVYINPVFEAHSNHRYNTADFMKIDPMLGTEEDFVSLCRSSHDRGIKVILDGVFNHTGDDSIYFNRKGRYSADGAYQSRQSPWFEWYHFTEWPDNYTGWWGIKSLPDISENHPGYRSFICGDGGVIDKWLSLGADGFRLDVADELPDDFIKEIRKAVKKHGNDKILIGEVWEDASNKISYGVRRRYLQGSELDSVMNYPFRNAIIGFLKDCDSEKFMNSVLAVCENYPPAMLCNMMNMLSTHDTPRLITELSFDGVREMSREEQASLYPDRDTYLRAVELEKLAVVLQYTLPGIPSVYYGDERGMMGGCDPFCRGFMCWDDYDENILEFYMKMGSIRRNLPQLAGPDFRPVKNSGACCVSYLRGNVLIAVNRGEEPADVMGYTVNPWSWIVREL